MLFWWGCPSFYFLIHNFNSTSFPTLMCLNLFLITAASFRFLIYRFNVTFYATFNIFFFTTACFTPFWYVYIDILIVGVTFSSTFSVYFIHKTAFFGEGLYVPSFFSVLFISVQYFNFRCNLLPKLIFYCIHQRKFFIHI